jgi:hypothetical protein
VARGDSTTLNRRLLRQASKRCTTKSASRRIAHLFGLRGGGAFGTNFQASINLYAQNGGEPSHSRVTRVVLAVLDAMHRVVGNSGRTRNGRQLPFPPLKFGHNEV